MAKDPAFLFYSTDFYEGTRTMLPEERACFIDLLIYQHQRGVIPNDIKRVALYCNGISENVVKDVLKIKFILTNKGWMSKDSYIKPYFNHSIYHHNWKGGVYETIAKIRNCPDYRHWKKSILKRDNYTCQLCGSIKFIHVHHIMEFSKYPNDRFNIDNGIALCRTCHIQIHKNKYYGT